MSPYGLYYKLNNFWSRKSPLQRLVVLVLLVVVAGGLITGGLLLSTTHTKQPVKGAVVSSTRPNIVYVLADDLDTKAMQYMPHVKSLLAEQGTTFPNYFYNQSQCCPSRSTILRGQYAQNTKVLDNGGPTGGYSAFYNNGDEKSTIGTWLQAGGYRTGFIGKYLNGYMGGGEPDDATNGKTTEPGTDDDFTSLPANHFPVGWDMWFGFNGGGYAEYNYKVNNSGTILSKGKDPADYGTDVMAAQAQSFLKSDQASAKPFYLEVATFAPHTPSVPDDQDKDLFPNVTYPQTPDFNEADITDKTSDLKNAPLLPKKTITASDAAFRKRIQSLQAVDRMVAGLVDTLSSQNLLSNTYIVFGSDNGYHLGEHRLKQGKLTAFEEDIKVPLIVRGPGVSKNTTNDQMIGNVDMAPTFAAIASAKTPDFIDGRSFLPLLSGQTPSWRDAYPIRGPGKGDYIDPFLGVRTTNYTYVEYTNGSKELYDLKQDPYELNNIYSTAPADLLSKLHDLTQQLATCSADSCRQYDVTSL